MPLKCACSNSFQKTMFSVAISQSVTDTVSGAVDLADLPRGSFAAAVRDLKVNFDFFFRK